MSSKGLTLQNIKLGISRKTGELRLNSSNLVWTSKSGGMEVVVESADIKTIELIEVDSKTKLIKIAFKDKSRDIVRFTGFGSVDERALIKALEKSSGLTVKTPKVDMRGFNWGEFVLKPHELRFRSLNKELRFSAPFDTMKQSVIQAKNEVSVEFKPRDDGFKGDELVEMRLYIPAAEDGEEEKKEDGTSGESYELFHELLVKKAGLSVDNTEIIARFEQVAFKLPRGRYQIQFFPERFVFRSVTFSYQIEYSQIKRLFIFKQPDFKMAFLIQLFPPIRQGQTTLYYLIMECPEDEHTSVPVNATEEELKTKYASSDGQQLLKQTTEGATYDVLSRVFLALSKVRIIQARKFKSSVKSGEQQCVKCSIGANSGYLYPLDKSMFFIWKPATYLRHVEIDYVEFERFNETLQATTFDMVVRKKKSGEKVVFTGVDKGEYIPLVEYFLKKPNINLIDRDIHENNLKGSGLSSMGTRTRKNLRKSADFAAMDIDMMESSGEADDEDYDIAEDAQQLAEDEQFDEEFDQIHTLDDAGLIDE